MSGGSLQLRLYRIARRDGAPIDLAADIAGIGRKEARFTEQDDAREPPGPDAFRLSPGMVRIALGCLADTPLGAATAVRWQA